jgi:hypothetical protein
VAVWELKKSPITWKTKWSRSKEHVHLQRRLADLGQRFRSAFSHLGPFPMSNVWMSSNRSLRKNRITPPYEVSQYVLDKSHPCYLNRMYKHEAHHHQHTREGPTAWELFAFDRWRKTTHSASCTTWGHCLVGPAVAPTLVLSSDQPVNHADHCNGGKRQFSSIFLKSILLIHVCEQTFGTTVALWQWSCQRDPGCSVQSPRELRPDQVF